MKTIRKMMALALAMVMVLAMGITVFADETSQHTITITNTDQNVTHSYEAYQVFKGKLDAAQEKLSDVVWGDDVDGELTIRVGNTPGVALPNTGGPGATLFTSLGAMLIALAGAGLVWMRKRRSAA